MVLIREDVKLVVSAGCLTVSVCLCVLSSVMATPSVYSPTTVSNPKSSCFVVPSDLLDIVRFGVKVVEVVSSKTLKPSPPIGV